MADNERSSKSKANEEESAQEQEDESSEQSGDEGKSRGSGTSNRRDWPLIWAILGVVAAATFAVVGWCSRNTPAVLVALALIPPFFFVAFERYVNRPSPDSGNNDSDDYHPKLRIWGYGIVLGAGLVVLYLLTRVVLFSIGSDHDKAATSASKAVDSASAAITGTTATAADSTIVNLMEYSANLMKRSAEVAFWRVWQDGLLLFFLSAALAIVMFALVNVSRSEI